MITILRGPIAKHIVDDGLCEFSLKVSIHRSSYFPLIPIILSQMTSPVKRKKGLSFHWYRFT